MITLLLLLLISLGISLLALIYCSYQLARNEKVYKIRRDWILTDNPNWSTHTYDYMFNPSHKNLWGLKFPSESDYQFSLK